MLVYPTEAFVDYIESLETRFTLVFAAVMQMTGVMRRLYKNMDGLSDGVLHCMNSSCLAKLCAMTKLYIKVRLHHALKWSNRQHKITGGKRNCKMLKLSHLWINYVYKNMDGLSDGVLHCMNSSCLAKLCAMTKLYIKVRLHHALKLSNRQHKVTGGKRNCKMLKLSHLWINYTFGIKFVYYIIRCCYDTLTFSLILTMDTP